MSIRTFVQVIADIITTLDKEFDIPIDPSVLTTAQEKGVRIVKGRNGKCFPSFFKKAKAVENERMLMNILPKYKPYQFPIKKTDRSFVKLSIIYYFPHTKSCPKWLDHSILPMTSRPDVDNISKAMIDCMTKCGYWEDDSQLNLSLDKFRSPQPHIHVGIKVKVVDYRKERV